MDKINVLIKRTDNSHDLPLPDYMSSQAAGMDLYANIEGSTIIEPGRYKSIPTGIAIALPIGYEAQVRPRSGLAYKYGITILNSPGTIDADYRGEISVLLVNLGEDKFEVRRGDRIAQLVINRVENANLIEVTFLPDSRRGQNGFGSTGK